MNIVIRSDASLHIGSGHIMRCLVLAKSLTIHGHQVSFASRPQQGDLISFIESKNFKVYRLNQPEKWLTPQDTSDYQAWLQVSWQDDAQSFIQQVDKVNLVIVDHYGIDAQWEHNIKDHFKCNLMAIDDLTRQHQADIILDQTLLRSPQEYKHLNPNSTVLAGSDFALINPHFFYLRNKLLHSKISIVQPRILVSMGGVDQPNATLKILKALSLLKDNAKVTVLLSPRAPHYKQVSEYCERHKDWLQHIDFTEKMAALMAEHHFAIGAPGTTSWERACLGIPSIIIPLAENQKTISKQLTKVGAAIKLELKEIKTSLRSSYQHLKKQYEEMHLNNLSICDGLGLQRVVQCINDCDAKQGNAIILRPANELDIKQVYEWQLLPQTRQYALIKELPTWCEHKKWMGKKLTQKMHFFYIIESLLNKDSIGVVRLDKNEDEVYTLSIFIDPHYFRQGFAKKALNYVNLLHPDITIQATVLEDNKASQHLFTSVNYSRVSPTRFIRYPLIRKTEDIS